MSAAGKYPWIVVTDGLVAQCLRCRAELPGPGPEGRMIGGYLDDLRVFQAVHRRCVPPLVETLPGEGEQP